MEVKFYMEHLCLPGINSYIIDPGHMTKMAAMPIYNKKPFKFFSSSEQCQMTF